MCGALLAEELSVHAEEHRLRPRDDGGQPGEGGLRDRLCLAGRGGPRRPVEDVHAPARAAVAVVVADRAHRDDDAAGGRRCRLDAVHEGRASVGRGRQGHRLRRPEVAGALGIGHLQLPLLRPGDDRAAAGPGGGRGLEVHVGGERRGRTERAGAGSPARHDQAAAVPAADHGAAVAGDVEALHAGAQRAARELLRAAGRRPHEELARPAGVRDVVPGDDRRAAVVVVDPDIAERVPSDRDPVRRFGADAQLEGARPVADALVEDERYAVRARVDTAQEALRAGQRRDVPRGVRGSGGRAQRHQGDAERGESNLRHAAGT